MNLKKEGFSKILIMLALVMIFADIVSAASISDDSWLDQVRTFIKVNIEGNFGYIAIVVGITIASFSALFGQWKMAGMAFLGGILIGSITFWAGVAQTMGQTMGQ